jgi:hypothetical protein
MFDCIINFFTQKENKKENNTIFSEQYRNGYNKLWINSLRNYKP